MNLHEHIPGATAADIERLPQRAIAALEHFVRSGYAVQKVNKTWHVRTGPYEPPILYSNEGLSSQSPAAFKRYLEVSNGEQ